MIQTKIFCKIILNIIWKNKLFLILFALIFGIVIVLVSFLSFPIFELKKEMSPEIFLKNFFDNPDSLGKVVLINFSFFLIPICLVNFTFVNVAIWSIKNKYTYILLLNRKGNYWKNNLIFFGLITIFNFISLIILIFILSFAQKLNWTDFKLINLWDLFFGFFQFNILTFLIGFLIGKSIKNLTVVIILGFFIFLLKIFLTVFIFNFEQLFQEDFFKKFAITFLFNFPALLFNFGFYNEHVRFFNIPYLNPVFKILVMYIFNTIIFLLPLFFVLKTKIFIK